MLPTILLAFYIVSGDVTGGKYTTEVLGPFDNKIVCETAREDIYKRANTPNSPIRLWLGDCVQGEWFTRVQKNWDRLQSMINKRKAIESQVLYDIMNRPNAPNPITLPRSAIVYPGDGPLGSLGNIKVVCNKVGCKVNNENGGY
jgi:hypothetical protein